MNKSPTTEPDVESVATSGRRADLRLVVMGAGPFAVPMFRDLLAAPHRVSLLATRPDRPVHAKQNGPRNLMRATAQERGISVFEPESVNSPAAHERLRQESADLFVVCDYGQILSAETLGLARLGGVNLHGSLLPKYRGAAPIQWAVYHGETETGVSVIHMTPRLDAGPVLTQKHLAIDPNETAGQLEERLAPLGGPAVLDAIALLARGEATGLPQDPALASRAPRLKKTDGLVDWRRTAAEIHNQVRAMHPWPKAHTRWQRPDGAELQLILESVAVSAEQSAVENAPGSVTVSGDRLLVACGAGSLAIERLQPAGKRPISAAEFIRGYRIQSGARFD